MTYNYLFNNSPKLYVALRGLYQLSLYFKNRTCKGDVLDGFGIATVEVEIWLHFLPTGRIKSRSNSFQEFLFRIRQSLCIFWT